MTTSDFEDRLRGWLADRDPGAVPEALRASAIQVPYEVRRPVTRLPERWHRMTDVQARHQAPGISRRTLAPVAVVALLVLGIVVGLLLASGSTQRLPAPYGPAANGNVAFAAGGDIFTVDPESGVTTAIVTESANDTDPVWSLDGTRIVFRRTLPDEAGDRLYLARADGGGLLSLTPEPFADISSYSFSPDGRTVMFVAGAGDIMIANADGTGVRSLGLPVTWCRGNGCEPSFRPPAGDQILLAFGNSTLNTVNFDGTGLQSLVDQRPNRGATAPRWSPDGTRVAYAAWPSDPGRLTVRTRIMNAGGTTDLALPTAPDSTWDGRPAWSNDGTRLAIIRGYGPMFERSVVAVVPADEGGRGIETEPSLLAGWDGIPDLEWAPDDSSILLTRYDGNHEPTQQVLIDPLTGDFRETKWKTESGPAWQRQAP